MPRKEIWDGTRFSELSWFWDPEKEWLLPVMCPFCSSVISASDITNQICKDDKEAVNGDVSM